MPGNEQGINSKPKIKQEIRKHLQEEIPIKNHALGGIFKVNEDLSHTRKDEMSKEKWLSGDIISVWPTGDSEKRGFDMTAGHFQKGV